MADHPSREEMRGLDAERILTDPMFVEAFDRVKEAYMEALMGCPRRDAEGRGYLLDAIKILETVKGHLEYTVETGKFSRKQAEQVKDLDEGRVLRFMRGRSV